MLVRDRKDVDLTSSHRHYVLEHFLHLRGSIQCSDRDAAIDQYLVFGTVGSRDSDQYAIAETVPVDADKRAC